MRARGRDDGAVIVEFAAVTVLFLLLLVGIITYGLIFAVQQTMSHAANEGARAAVAAETAEQAHSLAGDRASQALSPWASAEEVTTASSIDGCGSTGFCVVVTMPEADVVAVTTYYPYGTDAILPTLPILPTPDNLSGQSSLQLNPDAAAAE